jgi:hypothetical protein
MHKNFEEETINKNKTTVYTNLMDTVLILLEICDKKKISLEDENISVNLKNNYLGFSLLFKFFNRRSSIFNKFFIKKLYKRDS